ncbi:unnamed protein product, partial [Allacma fusca]
KHTSQEEKERIYCHNLFDTCGVSGFIESLDFILENKQFENKSEHFRSYLRTLLKVWKTPGNLEKFVVSSEFLTKFMNIVEFRLRTIGSLDGYDDVQKFMRSTYLDRIIYDYRVSEYFRLFSTLIILFDADKKIYEDFNVNLQPCCEDALKKVTQAIKSEKIDALLTLTEQETEICRKNLEHLEENCDWRPTWVMNFFKIINLPLHAIFEKTSNLARNCTLLTGNDSPNQSEEDLKNLYCNQIFEVWGVDGFTVSLHCSDEEAKTNLWHGFDHYLDKLLRVWSTSENLDKFVISSEFVNAFMGIGATLLKDFCFNYEEDVSKYFCLCLAVICLFDVDEIYDQFNDGLEPLFTNALEAINSKLLSSKLNFVEL